MGTCAVSSKAVDLLLGLPEGLATPVVFGIALLDVKTSEKMTGEEKLEVARQRKDLGALLFKQGRFDLAQQKYKAVGDFLARVDEVAEELKPAAKDLKRLSYLNRAVCSLKLGDNMRAKLCCDSVLDGEPFNEKALFRRASAMIGLGRDTDALSDLQSLLNKYPENFEARRLMQQVERRMHLALQKAQRKEKSLYLKMFAELGSNAEAEAGSDSRGILETAEVVQSKSE